MQKLKEQLEAKNQPYTSHFDQFDEERVTVGRLQFRESNDTDRYDVQLLPESVKANLVNVDCMKAHTLLAGALVLLKDMGIARITVDKDRVNF